MVESLRVRNVVWLLVLLAALAGCGAYAWVCQSFDTPSYARIWLFSLIGACSVALVFLARPIRSKRGCVFAIWIPAVLMRLALLPAAPSDDVNRYVWEGRLVAEGLSPYAAPASDARWSDSQDRHSRAMNHKDKPTAYPPLAELAFGVVSAVAYHPLAFKLFSVAADLLTLAGVLVLLRRRGMALAYAGFYAFNPIVLISYAAEAHFDALMVAALVWALVAHGAGWSHWAVGLASVATGIKWITLPLIPFFAGRRLFLGGLVAVTVLLLPALFFWDTLPQLLQGLFQFGATRSFNGPIYESLLTLGLPRVASSGLVGLVFVGVVAWRWSIHCDLRRARACAMPPESGAPSSAASSKREPHDEESFFIDTHIRWILGALIVLSPTVHLWYLAWILPFVCLRPSMPWLMFSLTGGVYFYVWINAAAGEWMLRPWQMVAFWLPFGLACLYELWSTRGRVAFPVKRSPKRGAASVAVVIPTLNVAERIGDALRSVAAQSLSVDEVIVVDAGSTDRTVEIAEGVDLPLRVVMCERGRGQQIATGMEAAQADWVIVLHADAALDPGSVAQVIAAARANPDTIAGALGQRFEDEQAVLLPIELLNDLRALFTRTAFGDQTQFFHRETTLVHELMPKQPLMEDVESSWRARECGAFLFLGQPTRVCHRKWKARDWFKRFKLVMRLVTRYRTARLQSRAAATALSESMYQEYYKPRK